MIDTFLDYAFIYVLRRRAQAPLDRVQHCLDQSRRPGDLGAATRRRAQGGAHHDAARPPRSSRRSASASAAGRSRRRARSRAPTRACLISRGSCRSSARREARSSTRGSSTTSCRPAAGVAHQGAQARQVPAHGALGAGQGSRPLHFGPSRGRCGAQVRGPACRQRDDPLQPAGGRGLRPRHDDPQPAVDALERAYGRDGTEPFLGCFVTGTDSGSVNRATSGWPMRHASHTSAWTADRIHGHAPQAAGPCTAPSAYRIGARRGAGARSVGSGLTWAGHTRGSPLTRASIIAPGTKMYAYYVVHAAEACVSAAAEAEAAGAAAAATLTANGWHSRVA